MLNYLSTVRFWLYFWDSGKIPETAWRVVFSR